MRAAVLAVAVLIVAASAGAAGIESLVMPGPLIQGHAEIESDCGQCHRPFDSGSEDGLCLACHTEVADDIAGAQGFHGLAPGIANTACRSCHTDHEGRSADIVGLNPDAFDHALTDYPLHGAHRGVPCQSCHEQGEKHREAGILCNDCHRQDDPHKQRLGANCGDCHDEAAWSQTDFDHDQTDFPLEGEHQDVACNLCHAGERYEDTPSDCASCHVLDDAHKSQFGPRCQDCHTVRGWETIAFDHDVDTKFRLDGKHAKVDCAACHSGHLYEEPAATDCLSCHRADDVHRGKRGPDCGECHGAVTWAKQRFDHDRDTKFALHGRHADLPCETCHTGTLFEEKELETTCIGCHRPDDVHAGQLGEDCADCHGQGERSWSQKVAFDHDLGAFPLLGLHASVACEDCHAAATFEDAKSDCIACHLPDDSHEKKLGETCGLCHNPNGWNVWRFDHDSQSSFPLHGAHEGVDCLTCHSQPVEGPSDGLTLSDRCAACHASEDPHRGRFGRDCGRCHGEQDWTGVKLP